MTQPPRSRAPRNWAPDQALRADATDEQIERRWDFLPASPSTRVPEVAREYAEARIKAFIAEALTELSPEVEARRAAASGGERANLYERKAAFLFDYLSDSIAPGKVLLSDGGCTVDDEPNVIELREDESLIDAVERDLMEHGTEKAKADYRALRASGERAGEVTPSPLNAMAAQVAAQNQKWWVGPDGPLTRNAGELLMLVVTEISECFEGERKNLMDDKLPHRRMAEVEIADTIVRLLDYAAARGYDLDGAMREKLEYNAKREDHKKESAKIATGNPLEFVSVAALSSRQDGQETPR